MKNLIEKKDFFLVKHGLVIILFTGGLTFLLLTLLKIDGSSILEKVINYYLNK